MQNIIVASTSTVHNSEYLDYLLDELKLLFKNSDAILFIPYARPSGISLDEYTKIAKLAFLKVDKNLVGIHEFQDPKEAVKKAKGIFVGGGNTFVLVDTLYKNDLFEVLKNQCRQ